MVIRSHPYIPPPTSALTAETNLVETILVVRDAKGQPVGGFHASEFQLLDNGKPQQILSFVETRLPEPGAPISGVAANKSAAKSPVAPTGKAVTLFFDDLHTDSPELMRSIGATRKFVTSALQPADRLAIVTSSGTAEQDFTSDPAMIEAKLDQIRTHVRHPVASCPVLKPVDAYLLIKGVDADVKAQATEQALLCLCGPSAEPSCMTSKTTVATAPGLAASAAETVWSQVEGQSSVAISALGEAVRHLAMVNGGPAHHGADFLRLSSSSHRPEKHDGSHCERRPALEHRDPFAGREKSGRRARNHHRQRHPAHPHRQHADDAPRRFLGASRKGFQGNRRAFFSQQQRPGGRFADGDHAVRQLPGFLQSRDAGRPVSQSENSV